MPTIKHLLNWGPDTPYCQTEVSYDPAEFESEESLRGFLSGAAIEALEMKESYINAGLGIGPGGMVQEAKNLGATEIARPAAPQMPTPPKFAQPQQGSAPAYQQQNAQSLPRGNVRMWQGDKWSGVQHADCGYELLYKPRGSRRLPDWASGTLSCTGGCTEERDGKSYPWSQLVKSVEDIWR